MQKVRTFAGTIFDRLAFSPTQPIAKPCTNICFSIMAQSLYRQKSKSIFFMCKYKLLIASFDL